MNPPILTQINGIPIKRNFVTDLPYNPALVHRAKASEKQAIFLKSSFGDRYETKPFGTLISIGSASSEAI
ncbi:hypothetical protein [Flavobacterium saliperosum]|uniref:Uncharacterized protein n=2 Tax=Flavobacterium saliperosum TaxID=329186 RepID=A0A1G4W563_9FLAO|nr:hypothetical protein [Flavobacterium saliperosum]SCX16949.1 hypothetical protein SAMN02927925_02459 [Flavobacterium saliperosum]